MAYGFDLAVNPLAARDAAWTPEQDAILNDAGFDAARAAISGWPGYRPTPLLSLPGLARAAGVASIRYKDEAHRFELESFKALGGAYAVGRLLAREVARREGVPEPSAEALLAGRHAGTVAAVTVCCATDGNHGRSVA